MNIQEGARRIRFVGNTILKFTSSGLVLGLILALLEPHFPNLNQTLHQSLMPIVLMLGLGSVFAGLLLLASWIVEGFAQPTRDTSA